MLALLFNFSLISNIYFSFPFPPSDLIYDVEGTSVVRVGSVWPAAADSSAKYTLFSLGTFYLFFLAFLPLQCILLYGLKNWLVPSFSRAKSSSEKLLHVVSCIVFPSIFRDWDLAKTEDLAEYERCWKQVSPWSDSGPSRRTWKAGKARHTLQYRFK